MPQERDAHSGTVGPSQQDTLRDAFRRRTHTLLAMGYARLETADYRDAHEEDITGALVESIKKHLDDPNSPKWCNDYNAQEEERQNVEGRTGKGRPRVDITFENSERRPRPHFRFESKRLGPNHGIRSYLGADGLGCFLAGTYFDFRTFSGRMKHGTLGKQRDSGFLKTPPWTRQRRNPLLER